MYNFSSDYKKLFEQLCDGATAVGFVDFKFDRGDKEEKPARDVVQVQRRAEFDIRFYARGISYGCIMPPLEDDAKITEFECFEKMCRALNLEFLPSNVAVFYQSSFHGKDWGACTKEHYDWVLANPVPHEKDGYMVRKLAVAS